MAYTAPTTRATSDLITASIWNTDLVDNIVALHARASDAYSQDAGTDITSTSTSFVAVDSTNYKFTITTTGGDILIGFNGCFASSSSSRIYLDVYYDTTTYFAGDDGIATTQVDSAVDGINFVVLLSGLSAASHTFELHWKCDSGTSTLFMGETTTVDMRPQFWVKEV